MPGGEYLARAGAFLIELVCGLYLLAVMLRYMLQIVRADFFYPIGQILLTVTEPALRRMRRWKLSVGGVDWSPPLLLFLVQSAELLCLAWLYGGSFPKVVGLPFLVVAELLEMLIWIYIIVLLGHALISWIQPHTYSPVIMVLHRLSEPLLIPVRKRIPPRAGLDWSLLIVLALLNLTLILVVAPLHDWGNRLAGAARGIF